MGHPPAETTAPPAEAPPRLGEASKGPAGGCRRDEVFRKQAQVLKALANETRLRIVDRLLRGECSVGELTSLIDSDRTTISKHLAILRSHGIVDDRREGNAVYYTLLTPCVANFFSCASQVIRERT